MQTNRLVPIGSTAFAGILAAMALPSPASAAVQKLDLANYHLDRRFDLPGGTASESSAITYNWDTGTLFVLGDEGDFITEVTTAGVPVSSMQLGSDFDDTEGLTYIGGGDFVVVEERIQDAFRIHYTAGTTPVTRASLPGVSLGGDVGNAGLEGVSYSRATGQYTFVKEKSPQDVLRATLNFPVPGSTTPVTPTSLPIPSPAANDLSDVQVLSDLPSLSGEPAAGNLLILSQESTRLMEVDPTGAVLSTFNFGLLTANAEGVTIGTDGTIYVTSEEPAVYVLTSVPEPAGAGLLAAGAGASVLRRRRRSALA
jgi:uncharacterized protein YjiK